MSRENLNQSFAHLLQELRNYKQASTQKSAGLGETSHPVMGADAGVKPTTEGDRSRENERDLKEQETQMAAESASAPPGGNQEDLNVKFGPITPKETGHDPGVETESAKDTKQDPGTAHPAKVAYSSNEYQKQAESLTAQLSQVSKSAEHLLKVLLDAKNEPEAPVTKSAAGQKSAGGNNTKAEVEKAAAAGQDLANIFASMNITPEDKQASDRYVFDLVKQAISAGVHSADQYVKVASGFFAQKQANDDEGASPAVEEESEEGSEPGEGGSDGDAGDEPENVGGIGPEISDDSMPSEEEIIAMLTGQGMSPEGGGMPTDAPGGGGGMPPDAMGGGGGGELDPELIQALLAELQAGGGSEMGGVAPTGGGSPPMMDPAAMGGDPMAGKMASKKASAKQLASVIIKAAGKQAVNGKAAKAARNSQAQKMLLDLIGR